MQKNKSKIDGERNIAEQVFVDVQSSTEVKNSQLIHDEIILMTESLIRVLDVKYKIEPMEDDVFIVHAIVTAEVDTDEINKLLKKLYGGRLMRVDKNLRHLLITSIAIGLVNFSPTFFYTEDNLQVSSIAYAEVQTYVASDSAIFDFGEENLQFMETVKNIAKKRAEQAVKEKAGVFIKSEKQRNLIPTMRMRITIVG